MSVDTLWLEKEQEVALKTFNKMAKPSTKEEVWRYSNIEELDLSAYKLIENGATLDSASNPTAVAALAEIQKDYGELSCVLVSQCGYLVDIWKSQEFVDSGAYAGRLKELKNAEKYPRMSASKVPDFFVTMNRAYMPDPIIIQVPKGASLEKPIGILELADLEGVKSFPHLIIDIAENATAQIIQLFKSGQVSNFSVPVVELNLAQASNLTYLSVGDLGDSSHQIATNVASVNAQANLSLNSVSLGGSSLRLKNDCKLEGRGASGNIMSLYFATNEQRFDFRTFQKHSGKDTNSNLLFKGAVDEKAGLVYSGMVRIAPEAQGSNAVQANHNLKLSQDAWVESVPNLEIENNDVVCSHATTVGPVDEEQRFYLESRGVSEFEAEKLIVAGFFKEALEMLPIAGARETLFKRLVSRFSTSSHFADSKN